MDQARSHFTHLGLLTGGLGVLLLWVCVQEPLFAPLSAMAFVGAAFWWNLNRPDPALRPAPAPARRCTGCATGCAECRERIDA